MLRSLYYPFSRCVDPAALKQLLLLFDNVTFLDPVEDASWRAKLFRDLERIEDPRFVSYRDIEDALTDLHAEGAIAVHRPEELAAFTAEETAASALSDLADPVWCGLASNPAAFRMPHQNRGRGGRPTWQIFPAKLPTSLREILLADASHGKHVIWAEREDFAWTLSYEAGSAAAINLHLAAAGELSLAPVTDSEMHHRLLLRKLVRSTTPESEWAAPSQPAVDATANYTALRLVQQLLPKTALSTATFASVLRFREETRMVRVAMMSELQAALAPIAKTASLAEIMACQRAAEEKIRKELREYQASLIAAREKVWPGVVRGISTAVTAGSAVALGIQFLAAGPYGVVAGSIAGASLGLLQTALDQRAELRKAQASASASVAYLSQLTTA